MLSRNNFKEVTKRDAQSVPHYGLRKLSVGVASVLLSTTLYMGVNASADTVTQPNTQSSPTTLPAPTSSSNVSSGSGSNATTSENSNAASANTQSSLTALSAPTSAQANTPKEVTSATDTNASAVPTSSSNVSSVSSSNANTSENSNAVSANTPATTTNPSSVSSAQPAGSLTNGASINAAKPVSVESNTVPLTSNTETAMPNDTSTVNANINDLVQPNTSLFSPFVSLAVVDNDSAPIYEATATWTIHYVQNGNTGKEVLPPTTFSMKYHRSVSASVTHGTVTHSYTAGQWEYVPGSFTQSGTHVVVQNAENQNIVRNTTTSDGKEADDFSFTFFVPEADGYKRIYGTSTLTNHLTHYKEGQYDQAKNMSETQYLEYNVDLPQTDVRTFTWTVHHKESGTDKTLKPDTTITAKYTRTVTNPSSSNPTYGDWSYVPGSLQQTGTPMNLSKEPTKQNDVHDTNSQGESGIFDEFTYTAMSSSIDGYLFVGSKGIRFTDMLPANSLVGYTLTGDGDQTIYYTPAKVEKQITFTHGYEIAFWLATPLGHPVLLSTMQTPSLDRGMFTVGESKTITGTAMYDSSTGKYSDVKFNSELRYDGTSVPDLSNYYVIIDQSSGSKETLSTWLKSNGYDGYHVSIPLSTEFNGKNSGFEVSIFAYGSATHFHTTFKHKNETGIEALNDENKGSSSSGYSDVSGAGQTAHHFVLIVVPYKTENQQVSRTINVHRPDGKIDTITQTAKLKNTSEISAEPYKGSASGPDWTTVANGTTKKVDNWNTGNWEAYNAPVIAGYTASQATVSAQTVTHDMGNKTVDITYTANAQSVSVKYVDDEASGAQVGTTQTLKGTTGSKVATNIKAPTNYVLRGTYPAEYTFTDAADQQLVVHLTHAKQSVNDQKTVTRTVNYTDPKTNQTKLVERQTATLTRTGTKDLVTNNTNWNAWDTGQFKAVSAPSVAGYQVTNGNAAGAMTVNDQSKDSTVTFTYTANAQTTHVKYVDKDNPSNVIHTTDLSGKTGQTVNVPSEVPTGWQLVSGQQVPTSITFTDNGYPDTTVKIEHKHTTVTPDHPKTTNDKLPDNPTKNYPAGVGQNDLNKTVTRTIQVTDPHTQKVTTTTQPVHLTRTADVDEVSGAVTYGKWTTGEWPVFNTPNVPGYMPSQAQVAKTTVTDTTKDQTVKITYAANPQSTTVNYVDPNNQVIHSTPIKGVTDQTVSVPNEVPTGWKLSNGSTVPTNLTFGPTGHPVVTVHIEHQHVTVTPDQPKTPSDKLPDNPTKNYPAGVDQNDLNKTITRTIKVVDPHTQKATTTTQPVHLTRTADVDEITGAVKYGNWTTGKWDAYVPDPVDGYTPSVKQVDALPVTATMQDETVTITYAANPQEMNILYVDHNHPATVVKIQTITGKTDQIVPVPNAMPAGWKLTPGQKIPEHISFGSQGHDNVIVEIEHAHVTVTPDQPKTTGDKLPDNPAKGYPTGVAKDDLNKTITRTIQVVDPHTQQVATTTQPVHLTRTADVDEVDGTVTYGKWTTGEWPAYSTPVVPGYTPNQANVAKATVTDTTKDQTVKITYAANPQSTAVNYVDKDGKVVHTTPVKGVTDQTVKVPNEVPTGWKLIDGQAVPKEITFGPDGYPAVTVKIEHGHVTVNPDQPKTPNDKLPDNPTKGYPTGVAKDDLNKTITRTIQVVDPHTQKMATTTQPVHLTRTANVDEVDGTVTYGKWTTGTWNEFITPVVPGYTPSQTNVAKTTVTDTTKDQTIKITYAANPQSTLVQLVDRRGKVVQTTVVDGHTDETVPVSVKVPNGWKLVAGEKLPTEIHFTANGHPIVQMTVEHGTVKVTPDHPYDDGTPLPDNPDLTFHGVDQAHLNKLITRTINVKAPTGKTTTEKQTVHLTRSATVDEVTGAVTYEAWTTGEWQAYEVPTVPGYTPNQAKVDQQTVTSQTQDQVVNIDYTANAQSTTVTLVDPRGKEVVTDKIDGHTDETVPVPTKVPAGWQLVPGEELPTEITFGPDGHPAVTVKIEHRHVTVTADHPYADNTPLPDNPSLGFHGVSETDLNRTITRTIVINVPGQSAKTVTQEAHLTRSATVDEATGAVVYEPWTTAEWPEFDAPAIDGYEPDQTKLPNVKVMVTTPDQTVVINYHQVAKAEPAASTTPASPATSAMPAKEVMPNASKAPQQASLPQTGNDDGNDLAALGLLAAGTTGMVLSKKERQTR